MTLRPQPTGQQATDWSTFANWGLVLPPNRPDRSVLRIVRSAASRIPRELPVLILGSTPEYRDIVAELGFRQVIVIDKHPQFYEMTAPLRAFTGNETLVAQDWREALPTLRRTAGLILSDLTLGNVPYSHHADFAHLLREALRPSGVLVDRVLTHTHPLIPLSTLRRSYRHKPINLITVNEFNADYLFLSELIAEGVVDTTDLYRYLDDILVDPPLAALSRLCRLVSPEGSVWYYGRSWSVVREAYHAPRYAQTQELLLNQFRGNCRMIIRDR